MAVRAPQSNHRLLYSPAATIWSHLMFCRAVGSWTLKVVLQFVQLMSASRWVVRPCCDTPLFCHLLTSFDGLTSLVGPYEKHTSVNTKHTLPPTVYLLLWNYMCWHWVMGACWSKTFRWLELYFNTSIKERVWQWDVRLMKQRFLLSLCFVTWGVNANKIGAGCFYFHGNKADFSLLMKPLLSTSVPHVFFFSLYFFYAATCDLPVPFKLNRNSCSGK